VLANSSVTSIHTTTPAENLPLTLSITVAIDFVEFLKHVANQLHVPLDSYETVSLGNACFQSCLKIECPGFVYEIHYVLSDEQKSHPDAMQDAAKKALNYLQICYGFTVRDMNLEAMRSAWARCFNRRNKCESLQLKISKNKKGKGIVGSSESIPRNWS